MTINGLIVKIAKDMLKLLEKEPSLVSLRGMSFNMESPADYEHPINQCLYLLRYLYAYSYEYFLAFKDMLDLVDGEIKTVNNILSIGCGAAFDYWSLKRAVNYDDLDGYDEVFNYTGIDIMPWLHPYFEEKNDSVNLYKQDFISWLRENPFVFSKSDIIIFPKSIGEFSNEYFSEMLSELERDACRISRKSVAVIGSFRTSKHIDDVERFDLFVTRLKSSSNYSEFKKKTSDIDCSQIPRDNRYFFDYPASVKNALGQLNEYCTRYKKNGNICCEGHNCAESKVFRNPITTLKYVDYKIVILKRGES